MSENELMTLAEKCRDSTEWFDGVYPKRAVELLGVASQTADGDIQFVAELLNEIVRLRELVRVSDDEASGQAARAEHLAKELAELRLAVLWTPSDKERSDAEQGSGSGSEGHADKQPGQRSYRYDPANTIP